MFTSFDRNGSGEISISEFCSLLKVMLGHSVDKRVVYKIMSSVDLDGGKSVTLHELSLFIFYVWRSQLQEVAGRAYLDTTLDDKSLGALVKEKEDIKNAIIRNFPRSWRDRVSNMTIESPFTTLFEQGKNTRTFRPHRSLAARTRPVSPVHTRPSSAATVRSSSASSPIKTKSTHRATSPTSKANSASSMMMFRMKQLNASVPYREGKILTVLPAISNVNDANFISRAKFVDALNATI